MRNRIVSALLAGALFITITPTGALTCSFRNPLIQFGQDPSVVYQDGSYYLVQSGASGLTITKADTITGLGRAEPAVVFVPPPGQPYSYDLWAPELAYLNGEWYIYVAATETPGNNPTHRMYVLQADTADPQATWTVKGKVFDPETDKWAIDGAPFEYDGRLFFVWSGWPGDVGDFPQNTYIAEMSDPLTLSSPRVLIGEPDQRWENSVAAIQEGQQPFIHDGQLSIIYAANASWTQSYTLGMLKLTGDDPLDPAAWTKVGPMMGDNRDGGVYGVGHSSSPVPSLDSSESWFFYHAKTRPQEGWDDRAILAQKFTWGDDGTPVFDPAPPLSAGLPIPAGEPCGQITLPESAAVTAEGDAYTLDGEFIDLGEPLVNTLGSFSIATRVQLSSLDQNVAILSQEGGITSNFVLGYVDGVFAFTAFDAFGRESVSAVSTAQPEADTWYHLVGVRDAVSGQLRLYVDGELAGSETSTYNWDARGSTIIGGALQATERVDLFSGQIGDIALYSGALDADEVAGLYAESQAGG
jgi:GH43 family beta-xylosidase